MWIGHLRDGVGRDVPDLCEAILIIERRPAFACQHDIKRSQRLGAIDIIALSFAFVEQTADDAEEPVRHH